MNFTQIVNIIRFVRYQYTYMKMSYCYPLYISISYHNIFSLNTRTYVGIHAIQNHTTLNCFGEGLVCQVENSRL